MSKHEPTSFEEALNLTGFGKFNILKSMLCSSIIVGMVFEIFSVSFLVPASSCELNTSSSQQGILAAMPLLGIIATSHFWGYLADTRGRKKVLQVSMAMAFVGGCVATFATNWIFYGVFKLLSSSSVSGAFALSITLLSECTPEDKRSRLLLFTNSIFFLCNGVMAVLAIPVLPLEFSYYVPGLGIQFNSWRLLNFLYCLPCLFCAIGLIFAYESPRFLLSIGEEEKALEVLRAIYVINNNKSSEEYPVKSVTLNEDKSNEKPRNFFSLMIAQTVPLFKPPLLRNTLLLSTLFVIVYVCLNPFLVWMPLMADGFMKSLDRGDEGLTFCQRLQTSFNTTNVQEDNGCSLNSFAMTMVFIIGVLLAFINTLIVGVSNYVGRKSLLISLQMLAGVSALLVNASSSWVLSAILFVAFISGVLNYGFLSTFAVDIFPTYVKAMAVCLTLMMGRGSAVFGINLLKYMLDNQCEESFYIFGSITIVGGILGFLLPEDKKPKQRKCPET